MNASKDLRYATDTLGQQQMKEKKCYHVDLPSFFISIVSFYFVLFIHPFSSVHCVMDAFCEHSNIVYELNYYLNKDDQKSDFSQL